MIFKKGLIFVSLFSYYNFLFSQNIDKHKVIIELRCKNTVFDINENKYLHLTNGDSVLIETMRFYVSNLEFLNEGKVVAQDKNTAHLIDAEIPQSLHFFVELPQKITYNQLRFNLGIDSLTNVSGAIGGDLDPTKGMYWTWQSGYINFKLEGKNPHCKTRNNEFQVHLGGYASPHNALQTIVLDTKNNKENTIIFDFFSFLNEVNYLQKPNIMSPCKEAIMMSKKIANSFFSKNINY
jgi:hypothetical protein